MRDRPGILMIYVEPAPYIVGLIEEIRSAWSGEITVLFLHNALSQPWGYKARGPAEVQLPANPFRALSQVRRLLATGKYDLVHLAGWGNWVLLGTLLLGVILRIPVTMESDTQLPYAQPRWKGLIKALTHRALLKLPAMFLPGGHRQAEYLQYYGVQDARIQVAHMTVDVSSILSFSASMESSKKRCFLRRYGVPEQSTKILYLGRLEPHKGIYDLYEAFKTLRQEIETVSLLIGGDGSLTSWVTRNLLAEQSVYYLGRLSGEQVWEAYGVSDLFVLPSHFEPWGLVVNEAMASGLPVIATERVGCVDDLVEDGKTGLIVPAQSPQALVTAMKMLVKNARARRSMRDRARCVIADWTLANAARATVGAWQKALR